MAVSLRPAVIATLSRSAVTIGGHDQPVTINSGMPRHGGAE
jgi:hypothetical protein